MWLTNNVRLQLLLQLAKGFKKIGFGEWLCHKGNGSSLFEGAILVKISPKDKLIHKLLKNNIKY
ncbi:hypothetical protein JCM17795_12820 [Galenea microaerophila]